MPNTQPTHHPDPEMSAAAKVRAAKAPRDAKGHFVATTNAQEQHVKALEARVAEVERLLDDSESRADDRTRLIGSLKEQAYIADDQIAALRADLANALDELRLCRQGNAKLIEERNEQKRVSDDRLRISESQKDTIAGDRKQITRLQLALGQVSELLHFRAPAPNESIDDWGSDLRDAYEEAMRSDAAELYARDIAERDRLRAVTECQKAALDALKARNIWQRIINAPVSHMDDCEVAK